MARREQGLTHAAWLRDTCTNRTRKFYGLDSDDAWGQARAAAKRAFDAAAAKGEQTAERWYITHQQVTYSFEG